MATRAPSEQDQYDVREQIGRGAFGSAFLVVQRDTKRQFVLKKIRLARQTDWQRKSSFQEMKLMSALNHPFIVPHIESWVDRGHTINIVYGYCDSGDLSSYLNRCRQKKVAIPEEQLKIWLVQMLMAMEYCHARNVLHRDIKASNIFLTSEGDIQIGDFGLATFREGGDSDDQSLVGTPHYMSPELLSKKPYGFASDVWSLGCVMYELTAQRPPFTAFNIHGLIQKIKKAPLPPLPPGYSQGWYCTIRNMLRKAPRDRPSVSDVLADPCLRDTYLAMRERALKLIPDLDLPEMPDPCELPPMPHTPGWPRGEPLDGPPRTPQLQTRRSAGVAGRALAAAGLKRPGTGGTGSGVEANGSAAASGGGGASGRAGRPPRDKKAREVVRSASGPPGRRPKNRRPKARLTGARPRPNDPPPDFHGDREQEILLGPGGSTEDEALHTDYDDSEGQIDEGFNEELEFVQVVRRSGTRDSSMLGDSEADEGGEGGGPEGEQGARGIRSLPGRAPLPPGDAERARGSAAATPTRRSGPIVSSWSPRTAEAPGVAGSAGSGGGRVSADSGAQLAGEPATPAAEGGGGVIESHAITPAPLTPALFGVRGDTAPGPGGGGAELASAVEAGSHAATDPELRGGPSMAERDPQSAMAAAEAALREEIEEAHHEGHPDEGGEYEEGEYEEEYDEDDDEYYDDEDEYYSDETSATERERERERLQLLEPALALCCRLYDRGRLEELGHMLHSLTGLSDPPGVIAHESGSRLHALHKARKESPFQLGDQVIVGNRRRLKAVIRYFGPTAFGPGEWVGMELERPDGKNDGVVNGVPYFSCPPGCGLFVRSSILRPEGPPDHYTGPTQM